MPDHYGEVTDLDDQVQAAQARALAIVNCHQCDDDGYTPARRVCDHRVRDTTHGRQTDARGDGQDSAAEGGSGAGGGGMSAPLPPRSSQDGRNYPPACPWASETAGAISGPKIATEFTRPNGKTYRPRKLGLQTHSWENTDGYDDSCGVIVFGTLSPDEAHESAIQACRYWYGMATAENPEPGWYRSGFQNGQRMWISDGDRGRPGVMFEAVDA